MEAEKLTFFERFFLSFRSFLDGFSTLGARPFYPRQHSIHPRTGVRGTTHSDKSVLGLKLLLRSLIIINKTEPCRGTTTKFSLHSENNHSFLVRLIQTCEFLAQFGSRDIGSGWVKDGEDELFTVQESVGDEF